MAYDWHKKMTSGEQFELQFRYICNVMKKSILFRLFNLLMAVVVLTTTTGFGLVEHSCIVKGKTYSLSTPQGHCKSCNAPLPKNGQTAVQKDKCCDDKTTYENVDYTSSLVQLTAKVVKNVTDAVVGVVTWFAQELVDLLAPKSSSLVASSSGVSLSGRSLLVFVQSFLI